MTSEFVIDGQVSEAGYDAWNVLVRNKYPDENIALICEVVNFRPALAGVHVFLEVVVNQYTRTKAYMLVPDEKCEKILGYKFLQTGDLEVSEKICADLVGCVVKWIYKEGQVELSAKHKLRSLADILDYWQPGDTVLSL